MNFLEVNKNGIFEPKNWWKYGIYWLLKSSLFNFFGNGKYSLFLRQKIDGKIIFTNYWKVLVLNFSGMGNTVFFEPRSWWKVGIYWLLRGSCFEVFRMGNTAFFPAKKVMERWYLLGLFELSMIFQDLGNMVFRAVLLQKSRLLFSDIIYVIIYDTIYFMLVFLLFSLWIEWASRNYLLSWIKNTYPFS